MLRIPALILALTAAAAADAAPLRVLEPAPDDRKSAANRSRGPVNNAQVPLNQRFSGLDAYLAHLEKMAPMDSAWYRLIKPGVYRLETGNLRGPYPGKRVFTRAELMRKFGFER